MASGPITSWQIDGETVKGFILGGSQISADGYSRHKIKRCLPLGRKVLINLDSILKSRDISLPTKVHLVKCMVFLIVMYGCESFTIKKSECLKNWFFWLCCWRRLLRIPWTARSNQSTPGGRGWRGRWEGGSGWGTHVNPWLFHFNVWQNPLQIKIK